MMGFLKLNKSACRWLVDHAFVSADEKALPSFKGYLYSVLDSQPDARILEIGGSSRPFLPADSGKEYVGLDLPGEADDDDVDTYDRYIRQSVEDPIEGTFDLVFSKYVFEHIEHNDRAISAISASLDDGGHLVAIVPCRWHPYAVATRLVGNRWQRRLIRLLRPEFAAVTGYPVFFDHCTPKAFERLLNQNGLVVERASVYWGASHYFEFCVPIYLAVKVFNRLAQKFDLQTVASAVVFHARKKPMKLNVNMDSGVKKHAILGRQPRGNVCQPQASRGMTEPRENA